MQPAKCVDGALDQPFDLLINPHIATDEVRRVTSALDCLDDLVAVCLVSAAHHDPGPVLREKNRNRFTNARGGSGHDTDLVPKS